MEVTLTDFLNQLKTITMEKEKTENLIKVMQAFLKGETIECKMRESEDLPSNWFVHDVDYWNTDAYMYRIKPKPQYRPFKDGNECWEEMQKHQPFGWIKIDGEYTNITKLDCKDSSFFAEGLWHQICRDDVSENNITFADGTPFGVKDNTPKEETTTKAYEDATKLAITKALVKHIISRD